MINRELTSEVSLFSRLQVRYRSGPTRRYRFNCQFGPLGYDNGSPIYASDSSQEDTEKLSKRHSKAYSQ